MSSINTISINTAETSPVVLAGGAKPKPVVQRKKKTFPVVARCEGAELESARTLELQSNVRVRGITVEDLSSQVIVIEPSIADTLLNIIQTKPDIKAPAIRKKKPISVADVIGSVNDAPKPAKKTTKNDKKRENMPPIDVEGAIIVQPEVLVEPASATVVPKAVKKRAPKKKAEVVITEPVLENIESNTFNLAIIQDALGEIAITCEDKSSTDPLNALDTKNPMEWFDEQAKQIDLRREPILNTFYVPLPELDEELYQLNTNTLYNNRFAYEEKSSTASLMPHSSVREIAHVEEYPGQPIYDGLSNIIANTLENEDYSDEIMVESLEFNGQTYWIDAQHNVLNKDTFDHIGVYKPETATIAFY